MFFDWAARPALLPGGLKVEIPAHHQVSPVVDGDHPKEACHVVAKGHEAGYLILVIIVEPVVGVVEIEDSDRSRADLEADMLGGPLPLVPAVIGLDQLAVSADEGEFRQDGVVVVPPWLPILRTQISYLAVVVLSVVNA